MFKYITKSFRKSGNSKQAKNFNHHEPKFINIYTTSLSIHQFIDMCCFQIFFIINNAVANIGCIYLFELLYSFFFPEYISKSRIAGSNSSSIFRFFFFFLIHLTAIHSGHANLNPTNGVLAFSFH